MIWVAIARGALPLPAYDEDLVQRAWQRMNRLIEVACHDQPPLPGRCAEEPLREAIQRGGAFERAVTPDARLAYLAGLAHRALGEPAAATAHYERAVALDADRADAWHDLGELRLEAGDHDGAQQAFTHVTALTAGEPTGWLGPWRLAEVAGHRGEPEAFERYLRQAIERGFDLRAVAKLPAWRQFAADPALGPSVRKLVTVYADAATLEALERPAR